VDFLADGFSVISDNLNRSLEKLVLVCCFKILNGWIPYLWDYEKI